jgi:hypothetical protein
MTRTSFRLTAAALIAATAAIGAVLPAPALASMGGTLSIELTPGSEDERRAMRAGLAIYAIAQGIRSSGHVHQNGHGNGAALRQLAGGGSVGLIHQDGNGHSASLDQQGTGQSYGIFQFGNGANGHVTQTGHGDTGVLIQFGW